MHVLLQLCHTTILIRLARVADTYTGRAAARCEYACAEKAQCVFARIACSAMPAVAMWHLRPGSGMEGTFETSAALGASHTGEGWTFLCD